MVKVSENHHGHSGHHQTLTFGRPADVETEPAIFFPNFFPMEGFPIPGPTGRGEEEPDAGWLLELVVMATVLRLPADDICWALCKDRANLIKKAFKHEYLSDAMAFTCNKSLLQFFHPM